MSTFEGLVLQGEVLIKGKRRHGLLSDDPEIGKLLTVGMVFQNGALFDSLTVGQNVGFLLYEHTTLKPSRIQVTLSSPPHTIQSASGKFWPVKLHSQQIQVQSGL